MKKALKHRNRRIGSPKEDADIYRTFNVPDQKGKGTSKSFNIRVVSKKDETHQTVFEEKTIKNEQSVSEKTKLLQVLEDTYKEKQF